MLTYFSLSPVSRPLTSKWSAAPGRGESSHTLAHTPKHVMSCSLTHVKTHAYTHNDKHQLLQSHFPSFSLTSACVRPRTATSCSYTHVRIRMRICVWLFVYFCMVSLLCLCSVVPACVCDVCIYIPSSPPIPSPKHSSSCPISPCGFKGWGVVGIPAAFP